jgi:hypothetical protein
MFLFALTAAERQELRVALEAHVADLRADISHTERCVDLEELESRRALLEGVLRRLAGTTATSVEHGPDGAPFADLPDRTPGA